MSEVANWREPVEVESTNSPKDRSTVLKTAPTTGQDWLPHEVYQLCL